MIVFLTGAGLSANSGLPTYRGPGGLYEEGNTESGLPIEEFLSAKNQIENPEEVNSYIQKMANIITEAEPNDIHKSIAQLESIVETPIRVFTQNIDDLHERAGSSNVIHLHGTVSDPVLFGANIPSWALGELDYVLPQAQVCVIIGTSIVFNYLIDWVNMLKKWNCKIILLDTDPEHTLSKTAQIHCTNPTQFTKIIQTVI